MKHIDILKADDKDAPLISEIKTKAFEDEKIRFRPTQIPSWFEHDWYSDIQGNLRLIQEYCVYLITIDEIVIGTFWLHVIDKYTMKLEDFCILPEYQGLGYGYKALLMMEKMHPEKQRWVLGTPFYSVRNQHLYEKVGYKKIGTEANGTVFQYEKCTSPL